MGVHIFSDRLLADRAVVGKVEGMNIKTIVKIALFLVAITVLLYWRDVWGWVSAKTWSELAETILGFALKYFYLALFGWLAVTIPHYLNPWLKLARMNGRRKLRAARRSRNDGLQVEARTTMPRMNKNEAIAWMVSQMAKSQTIPSPRARNASRLDESGTDIQLRF